MGEVELDRLESNEFGVTYAKTVARLDLHARAFEHGLPARVDVVEVERVQGEGEGGTELRRHVRGGRIEGAIEARVVGFDGDFEHGQPCGITRG
jgi:hypothetical protein